MLLSLAPFMLAFAVLMHTSSSIARTVSADLCLRRRRSNTRTLFVSSLISRPNDSSKTDRFGITSQSTEDAIRNRINAVRFSNIFQRRATDYFFIFSVRGGDDAVHINSRDTINSTKSRGVSLSLFLTYLSVMCAKCALPTTLAILTLPDSGLLHSNTVLTRQGMMSRLLALSTVAIALGKLLLGPIIDNLGGVLSLQIALSTLLICLGCIGFGPTTCPTLTSFACYWIIVDFAFSSCWAACVKTIRDTLPQTNWVKEVGRLAMAARIGNALGFAFFASLLQWTITGVSAPSIEEWRWVYRAAALIQFIPLTMLTHYGSGVTNKGMTYKREESVKASRPDQSLSILRYQARKPEFWLHLISRSLIMVLVSFLLFIPSFMTQCYGMTSSSSARVGSLFAMGCLLSVSTLSEKTFPSVGMITTGPRESRLIQVHYRRKAYSMLAFLATSTLCLLIQSIFLLGTISLTPLIGSLLMFLFGFSLGKTNRPSFMTAHSLGTYDNILYYLFLSAIPFYLPATMFALKNGGKVGSATIADAFDVCGFGLLALFTGYVARILDVKNKRAWIPVFSLMIGGSTIAMTSLFWAITLEGDRESKENSREDLIS